MGSCYIGDHIAEDSLQTDITICNIEKPQQKYHLGTVSDRLKRGGIGGGGLNIFYWIQTLALSFCIGSKHSVRMKVI